MAKKYSYKPVKSSYGSKKIQSLVKKLTERRKSKIKNKKVKKVKY